MGKIIDVIRRQYEKQIKNKWYESYFLIDMHGVITRPHHNKLMLDLYPYALESLSLLTNRSDIRMILYTSSHEFQILYYIRQLEKLGVEFDYINVNPEIGEDDFGCYKHKPYFDVYLDDKAGFDAEIEWWDIWKFLREDKQPDENWRNPIRDKRRKEYNIRKVEK